MPQKVCSCIDSGSISIAQRLDVDSMPASDRTFSLRLVAGADDYESEAVLRITLVNIDDNAPILEKGGLDNEVFPPLFYCSVKAGVEVNATRFG